MAESAPVAVITTDEVHPYTIEIIHKQAYCCCGQVREIYPWLEKTFEAFPHIRVVVLVNDNPGDVVMAKILQMALIQDLMKADDRTFIQVDRVNGQIPKYN